MDHKRPDTLPKNWVKTSIGAIYDVIGGGTPSTSIAKYWGGDTPWITSADIDGVREIKVIRYVTQKGIQKSTTNKVPNRTLLVVTRVGLGKIAISDKPICFSQDLQGLVQRLDLIFPEYSLFYLSFELQRLKFEGRGTTISGITKKQLKDTGFPLPPYQEQRRIVAKIEELFSELDKGIESLKTARRQLEVYRQSVLKHAFEGKLTAQWRKENKDKIETVEQFIERIPIPVQPRGGRAASADVIEGGAAMAVNIPAKAPPAGWSWVSLLRAARQETGHTPSRKHPEYWDGDQFWIGIADARLHHGKEIEDTIQKVTPKGLDNSSARTLPSKTVCLSRTASVGYVCIMARPMATSQDFATWTCTEALEPKFLMYALMAEGNEIRRFGKGTTHTTIYFPEIRAMTICLPPLEEQRAIIDAVEAKLQQLDALAADIDSSLAHCDVLRRSILKKAFAGQLVAQNPNDEPASVLLDRIKVEKEQASKSREITKRTRKKRTVA